MEYRIRLDSGQNIKKITTHGVTQSVFNLQIDS